jgi:hypothetical protein
MAVYHDDVAEVFQHLFLFRREFLCHFHYLNGYAGYLDVSEVVLKGTGGAHLAAVIII